MLTQGQVTSVDDEDYELVSQFKWCAMRRTQGDGYYAATSYGGKKLLLHRLLLAAPACATVQHINGITLDNTRSNLRICTQRQGGANRKLNSDSASGFKGVTWNKRDARWQARITIHGKTRHLGCFDTAEQASRAYDAAAVALWGEYARCNP